MTPESARATYESATSIAHDLILDLVLSGKVKAGDPLREARLAEQLNLSRTPVREALRQLAFEGHVVLSHNRGAEVSETSPEAFAELFELRILLEGFGAGLAAMRISSEDLDELRRIHDMAEDITRRRTENYRTELVRLNAEFHGTIREAAGNRLLSGFIQSLTSVTLLRTTFAAYSEQQLLQSVNQHKELINALEARDRMLAEMVMRVHIHGARSTLTAEIGGEEMMMESSAEA